MSRPSPLRAFDHALAQVERRVALLSRVRPINASEERARLLAELRAGHDPVAHFRHARGPALGECRRLLEAIIEAAPGQGALGALYGGRAAELDLEARMVEAVGQPAFRELAAERYRPPDEEDARWAEESASTWAALTAQPTDAIASDDAADPRSLVSCLRRRLGALRLPVRVVITELDTHAATGDGVVYVGSGRRHSSVASMRIALHEVEAHAAPRVAAHAERLGLYRVGTAGASEDEEGRALTLEADLGYLDDARRRHLGLRHVAASAVGKGAEWSETARVLLELGASAVEAVDIASRAHRGGGLAREIAYLPAFRRARREMSAAPGLARQMARGRISFAAARQLAAGGYEASEAADANCSRSGRADV